MNWISWRLIITMIQAPHTASAKLQKDGIEQLAEKQNRSANLLNGELTDARVANWRLSPTKRSRPSIEPSWRREGLTYNYHAEVAVRWKRPNVSRSRRRECGMALQTAYNRACWTDLPCPYGCKAHYRACVVAGNLYVISLDYCICGWGGEATPKLRFPEWFVGVYVF